MQTFSKDFYGIAPLYAESLDVAKVLMAQFCATKKSGKVSIVIPDNNKYAKAFVGYFQLIPMIKQLHMSTNPGKTVTSQDGVYGITSPDIG